MSEPLKVDTVIVGAGVAGISTAIHLFDKHYNDLIILEAQDYIGGRCQTFDYEKGFLEMGSEWLHGQRHNPLYDIALKHDLILEEDKPFQDKQPTENYQFMTQYGEYIPIDFANKICHLLDNAFYKASHYKPKGEVLTDRLVGEYLYEKFMDKCQKEFNLDFKSNQQQQIDVFCKKFNQECTLNDLKALLNGFFIWRCKVENVSKGCHNIYNMSLRDFCSYASLPGKQKVQPKHGMSSILEAVISKHKHEFYQKLHLQHKLDKILLCEQLNPNGNTDCSHCYYTNDKTKVVLLVSNLIDSTKMVFICKHVLITTSLGYLKDNLDKLIEPSRYILDEKLQAVDRLGFGNFCKIFLSYEKPFWSTDFKGVHLIWLPGYDISTKNIETLNHDLKEKKMWFHSISSLSLVYSQDKVLCAYISSNKCMEDLDDDEIAKQCTDLLRRFLRKSVSYPKLILKCDWSNNDYVKGSKCFLSLDSKPALIDTLEAPIQFDDKPYVLFGGEATNKHFASVHGAYLSGSIESQRILKSK